MVIARRTSIILGVLLALIGLGARADVAGSQPPVIQTDALIPNVQILSFALGQHVPAGYHLSGAAGDYRTVDDGVALLVWTTRQGIIYHLEARQANRLRLDGLSLSAGYRVFHTILTRRGWRPFTCQAGPGLRSPESFRSLTDVRWTRQGAWVNLSLASYEGVFGSCNQGFGGPPSIVRG
jgi:hypothetical protein